MKITQIKLNFELLRSIFGVMVFRFLDFLYPRLRVTWRIRKRFIYLLGENLLPPLRGRRASMPRKDKRGERRKIKGSRHKDALIGDKEQNEKQKKGKARNRERDPNLATLDPWITS